MVRGLDVEGRRCTPYFPATCAHALENVGGQRYDLRDLARQLADQVEPGDRVLADHHGLLLWELRDQPAAGVEIRELPETLPELEAVTA